MSEALVISRSIDIDVSASELWAKTAEDFGGIDKWIASISDVTFHPTASGNLLGAERVCVSPFGETHETMVIYDEAQRHFAYEIEGLPPLISRAVNNWLITETGDNQSAIEFRVELDLVPNADAEMVATLKAQMGDLLSQVTEELKHYVETGEAHPRKIEAMQAS